MLRRPLAWGLKTGARVSPCVWRESGKGCGAWPGLVAVDVAEGVGVTVAEVQAVDVAGVGCRGRGRGCKRWTAAARGIGGGGGCAAHRGAFTAMHGVGRFRA